MKNISLSHIIISLLFIIFLSTPMLVSVTSDPERVSKAEKRKLAQFPKLTFSPSLLKTFPKQFEDYVDDHFGFRSQIVKKHNYSLYKIFKVSPSSMVTIGSDNWLFFNGDYSLFDYLGQITYTDHQLEKTSRLLEDREEWLNSMGIRYLFLPIPNKESIYEEHLPHDLKINRGNTKYDQIVGFAKQYSSFRNFIDVQQLLLNHKKENQLYLKTDTHWNHNGIYIVYQEVMKKIQNWFPDIPTLQLKKEKIWIKDYSGDLAYLMNLQGLVTETAPGINIKTSCQTKHEKKLTSIKDLPTYKELPNAYIPVTSGCEKKKYKVLFIHDSFGLLLRPYFSQQFETVIYVNYMNFEIAKSLIEEERPDIVIDERVGRNLEKALLPDPEIEQIVLRNKFAKLTTIEQQDIHKLQASHNESTSILLHSSSNENRPNVIKLDINSNNSTTLSICYTNHETTDKQCSIRQINTGNNELFLRILQPGHTGNLELSARPSVYWSLQSYTLKVEGNY